MDTTIRPDIESVPRLYTASQREKSRSQGRMYTRMSVAGRKDDAQRFLVQMLDALDAGIDANVDKASLSDLAKCAHDAITKLVAGMRTDLDREGCDERDADVNMAELDALIARLA